MAMQLIDHNRFPPGGFPYFEPRLNWRAPDPKLPFDMIVDQIQAVRAANRAAGLDPSREACEAALDSFVANQPKLRNNPEWVIDPASAVARVTQASRKTVGGCPTCGKGRRK